MNTPSDVRTDFSKKVKKVGFRLWTYYELKNSRKKERKTLEAQSPKTDQPRVSKKDRKENRSSTITSHWTESRGTKDYRSAGKGG